MMTSIEEALKELNLRRPPAYKALGDIPLKVFAMLHVYVGLSDIEQALLFDTTPALVIEKRNKAKLKQQDIEVEYIDEYDTLHTVDEKIAWIDKQRHLFAVGSKEKSVKDKDQITVLKDMRVDLVKERDADIAEGVDLYVRLLSFFKTDIIPSVRKAFYAAISNLKQEITLKVFNNVCEMFHVEQNEEREDLLLKAMGDAEKIKVSFEINQLFVDACLSNSTLHSKIDQYLERTKKPKLLGGGAGKDIGTKSLQGGKQYQRMREGKK